VTTREQLDALLADSERVPMMPDRRLYRLQVDVADARRLRPDLATFVAGA